MTWEYGECLGDHVYVAKRRHKRRCGLCGHRIRRGDRVRRYGFLFDGSVATCVEHAACADVAGNHWAEDYDWNRMLDGHDYPDRRFEAMQALMKERSRD